MAKKKETPVQTNRDRLNYLQEEKQRLDRKINEMVNQPGYEHIRELLKDQHAVMIEIYDLLSNWHDINKPRKV